MKRPLTKYGVLVICMAPFLLSGLVFVGWMARHFTIHVGIENKELAGSLVWATFPAAAAYVVGAVFTIYHLLIQSRYPLRTLTVLCMASVLIGFLVYLPPVEANRALPSTLEHRMFASTLPSFP